MPFNRPTLKDLVADAEAEIAISLPGADAQLRRTVLGVVARVISGATHGLYGYIEHVAKQILPDTAEAEYLDRHAQIWGIERKAATFAIGNVTFTGSGGTVIAAGTELARADGVNYITDAEVSIDGGSAIAAVTAVAAGETANAVAATQLSLVSPIAGIDSIATVDGAALTGGSDEEVDQTLLERVLERIQEPPHGGAGFDYPTWAREVSGVTRAWVYAQELGLGTVTVRFMMDDTYADGIPVAGDVTTVQDYIDTYRPVTADVTVVAPVAVPLAFDISGLDPATAEVKAAITAELADLIRREGEPGGTILLSHIREAISIAAGETDHAVVAPAADVNHATGEIATMGAIAWS